MALLPVTVIKVPVWITFHCVHNGLSVDLNWNIGYLFSSFLQVHYVKVHKTSVLQRTLASRPSTHRFPNLLATLFCCTVSDACKLVDQLMVRITRWISKKLNLATTLASNLLRDDQKYFSKKKFLWKISRTNWWNNCFQFYTESASVISQTFTLAKRA